ncbi:MAG: hypothetical protein AB7K52_06610 [Phycisphaerales bacterium]
MRSTITFDGAGNLMRGFWIIVACLAAIAAAMLAFSRTGTRAAPATPVDRVDSTPADVRPPVSPPAAPTPAPAESAASTLPSAPEAPPPATGGDPLAELAATATKPVTDAASSPDASASAPARSATAPASNAPSTTSAGTRPFAFPADEAFPADTVVPSTALERADGTLLLDDRFVVKGKGTKDDPYRVTWELLESAQDVYKPRLGQKRLPQRVTFLNGKYVRLTGFVAFPITSGNPRECLVMLNQWDGCCIGVPPTAYDAVEVKLIKPATGNDRLAVHGTLEGRFRVDAYEEGGWLLGLYLMDDAVLKPDL